MRVVENSRKKLSVECKISDRRNEQVASDFQRVRGIRDKCYEKYFIDNVEEGKNYCAIISWKTCNEGKVTAL